MRKRLLIYMYTILYIVAGTALVTGCQPAVEHPTAVNALPRMYPDYTDITLPPNIAPLNFLLRDQPDAIVVEVDGIRVASANGAELHFPLKAWRKLLSEHVGKTMRVQVYARKEGKWTAYKAFHWTVAREPVDPYLTYRLIEPDYEVWNHLQIIQRHVEDFQEKALGDHHLLENRCMNCHVTAHQDPALSMMYVRGEGGGAILNQHGTLRKLNINAEELISGSVYYDFSPSGRYIVFSSNLIIPAYHARPEKRMEVYDSRSDVYVADLQAHEIITSPLTADSTLLETFPTFSPDGKYIYYCVAHRQALYDPTFDNLQYDLVRVAFDERTGDIGKEVETVYSLNEAPDKDKHSACHPKISPDSHYLLYTVARYGTFPIWHREADPQLLDLRTGEINTLANVNSDKSDTYHSWSSNSHWFVFASKRDDGLYGKPYFCHVDDNGKASKPFVLPQESPARYDETLKSFNAPELCRGELPFNALDVASAMKKQAEVFRLRK